MTLAEVNSRFQNGPTLFESKKKSSIKDPFDCVVFRDSHVGVIYKIDIINRIPDALKASALSGTGHELI